MINDITLVSNVTLFEDDHCCVVSIIIIINNIISQHFVWTCCRLPRGVAGREIVSAGGDP
jgi:hypothetical protein